MSAGVIYWLRNDLRLHDNPALLLAARRAREQGGWLLPVYLHDPQQQRDTRWGFARMGSHRRAFLAQALDDLKPRLQALGSDLIELQGSPALLLPGLMRQLGASRLVCEAIAAPEEQDAVQALRAAGLQVETVWQSSLIDPADLPFAPEAVPDTFTTFRQKLERAGVLEALPRPAPDALPPLPAASAAMAPGAAGDSAAQGAPALRAWLAAATARPDSPRPAADPRSSFPYAEARCHGGERAALAHLRQYCARGLPHSYKDTRNGLAGLDYSSKFSPWLATGALSARQAMAAIRAFEAERGANDGSYWLWFELLWRDHFRWMQCKHGRRLYGPRGLSDLHLPAHNARGFERWTQGRTGNPLVDAGMRELICTGYLSNRLRQNVASYLVHDLGGDWRAGAAWFESQLLDYDVQSNQGNWLYVAGRGTDPRGGRRFNTHKQAQDYDRDGAYRRLWGQP
ncbi:MAG: DASH family cryptochrome [Burkholderiales bacterium RIFOXYC12_FULL_65_23]|uniref:DASH family cryptochrome n=1 Tax=Malikia spinosa TaxID=86180 RepID=UPI0008CA8CAD|nr:DASH family cryptochrome [Malikia spinosa]OGB69461.1 MAG: DASH family cryptochrome [Burkholderiales bacterium RIFOXYC12_FULL_65_23]